MTPEQWRGVAGLYLSARDKSHRLPKLSERERRALWDFVMRVDDFWPEFARELPARLADPNFGRIVGRNGDRLPAHDPKPEGGA